MSIKLRVALVFTLALAVAFALGSWLFLSQLHAQLVTQHGQGAAGAVPVGRERAPAARSGHRTMSWSRSSARPAG